MMIIVVAVVVGGVAGGGLYEEGSVRGSTETCMVLGDYRKREMGLSSCLLY